jgi:hypothetical protein
MQKYRFDKGPLWEYTFTVGRERPEGAMPENADKKKYNPKDLYQTPEFPEDQGTREVYDAPERRGGWIVAAATAVALVAALAVLILTGVVKLPFGPSASPGASAAPGAFAPPAGQPAVSELMSGNDHTLAAANGKYYDWIELYNPTDRSIDLAGYFLSDDASNPKKFALPSRTLESRAFLVVFASDKKSNASEIHAPFKLSASGTVLFSAPDGALIQRIDYPKLPKDSSFAADMNDFARWSQADKPTPGGANG